MVFTAKRLRVSSVGTVSLKTKLEGVPSDVRLACDFAKLYLL